MVGWQNPKRVRAVESHFSRKTREMGHPVLIQCEQLLFEDFDCFGGGGVLYPVGAGDVTERSLVDG
jgi:hypothetical protein